MQLNPGAALHGFRFTTAEELPEIDGNAYAARHEASGARLLYLKNDDNNKSFAIGFRTPPKDDTGVFHILEHSVLCGSKRFPVKEPFVDLLKSSMQTFLNAMTFADKTLYPVASTNEQDLFNLMDVYLDAVFHPRIYEKRAIFEQEGWHYEFMSENGEDPAGLDADQLKLVHNGVVFNEMKGALSDASSVLYDELQKALFPDTCYAFESGGTPAAIPTLTYEEYLDEHRRHYRTDNSYIILYGNLDIDRTLEFLDGRYLTPLVAEQQQADDERLAAGLEPLRPRTIEAQEPIAAGFLQHRMDTAPENACAACGYVIGSSAERTRATAAEILLDALFGSNEAPLKRALLDAEVAHDVHAFVSDALLQPFAVVQLQMPAPGKAEGLAELIEQSVRKMLDEGLDKELIEAALSHEEFQMREHDMGYADGVINSMICLSSWLYDDDTPLDYLRYERVFAELRSLLDTDYYEKLCLELFCENSHMASVEVVPAPGEAEDERAAELDAKNRSLTPDERKAIMKEVEQLRLLQEAPDAPEATATLPRLGVADIGAALDEAPYALDPQAPITCLRHSVHTRGIAYAYRYFDLDRLSFEDLPYASVLALVLGKLDTAEHTAAEVDTLVQGKLGNLNFFTEICEDYGDSTNPRALFVVSSSALSANVNYLAKLPLEVMLKTDFSNSGKILDVLKQRKISLEQGFANSGHSCATMRCKSYYDEAGVIAEQLSNVGFYQFLCELIDQYDERAGELAERLARTAKQLFDDGSCTISFGGSDDDYARFWAAEPGCGSDGDTQRKLQIPKPTVRNEAFVVPSDVCYVALGWDRRLLSEPYNNAWVVAGRALSYDYLWNEVRVKGGAYGTGFQALKSGNMRFYSYRDPHLDETLERFESASKWLADCDPTQDAFEGFIVATVAAFDAPVKPRGLIKRQAQRFFSNLPADERKQNRQKTLASTVQGIRELAPVLEAAAAKHAICAFGSREILESSNAGLTVIALVG